jgi:hypothetical protein
MTERYIMRFYGSCSHIEDTESKELFDQFSAPRELTTWPGRPRKIIVKNEVTTEKDGTKIVHVHPYRYCCCKACMLSQMEADMIDD